MKRFLWMLAALFAALAVQAQDDVLQKYTEMGDVNTIYVTKNRLSQLPLDQLDVPGMGEMVGKIETLKYLVSKGDKAGKAMGTKLPRQLEGKGFATKVSTRQDGRQVTIMQSRRNPRRVVIILYQKPQATVISMDGDFGEIK